MAAIGIIGTLVFAGVSIWTYARYTDERDSTQSKIDTAVEQAGVDKETELREELQEQLKSPFFVYEVPDTTTGIKVKYPATWSVYAEDKEDSGSDDLVSATFSSDIVRPREADTRYALRVRLIDEQYDESIKDFDSRIETGNVTAKSITFEEYPDTKAIRFDGEIGNNISGSFVMIQIRRQTLRIWTEAPEFVEDFDQILEQLEFKP